MSVARSSRSLAQTRTARRLLPARPLTPDRRNRRSGPRGLVHIDVDAKVPEFELGPLRHWILERFDARVSDVGVVRLDHQPTETTLVIDLHGCRHAGIDRHCQQGEEPAPRPKIEAIGGRIALHLPFTSGRQVARRARPLTNDRQRIKHETQGLRVCRRGPPHPGPARRFAARGTKEYLVAQPCVR
jgi:hypothetical protein